MRLLKRKATEDSIEVKKNWYADRYQTVVVQRNFLALVTLISLAGIIFSVLSVANITASKTIEPFVIEVEEKTGITNVIRPLQKEKYAFDEVLRRYFIYQYVTKRESYDASTFDYNYFTFVRLFSDTPVYASFRREVNATNPNSPVRLGSSQRIIKIKSITFPPAATGQPGFVSQIHFKSEDPSGVKNKVITMNFDYFDLSLNQEDRAVNPLGFQVTGYRVDDEILQ
jgi:type IV secretion system protein VirB8